MSKKTSTKSAATKKSAKAKTAKQAATASSSECPKGGDHDWTEENGEAFCRKCKEPKNAKPKRGAKKAKDVKPAKDKKLSAIHASAKLLADSGEPMNCKTLIETMATKGLWSSPGGQTPHATLYSAIIREISTKGKEARFKKTDRGNFAFNG